MYFYSLRPMCHCWNPVLNLHACMGAVTTEMCLTFLLPIRKAAKELRNSVPYLSHIKAYVLHTGLKGDRLSNPHQHNWAQDALPEEKAICKKHKTQGCYHLLNMLGRQTLDGGATQPCVSEGKDAHYIKEALAGFKYDCQQHPCSSTSEWEWHPASVFKSKPFGFEKTLHSLFPTWYFFSHMYSKVTYSTHSTEQSLDPKAERILLIKKKWWLSSMA